ncbi:MAG: type II toxin-antitoxin system RelB/DinJ family antitoxin [Oscillospiraceae bacterium]|nr:type II toxin-antitoxin system RelB/DinJ family antitoxin [Oscillospiraceae bacterium]
MAKTANLYVRIEPDVKEQAESILASLGIPASNAINMFYKQIILHNGMPFELRLPDKMPLSMGRMTEEELDNALEQGYDDMVNGRTRPAADVFADIHKEAAV